MSDPFLGEIRLISFNFPPKGWALCDGQLLPINQNQALFSLLGTTFGGDGRTNFALPNLQGRTAMHAGNGHNQSEQGGETDHTLSVSEMPQHVHAVNATSSVATDTTRPAASVMLAQSGGSNLYGSANNLQPMSQSALATAGAVQPHTNVQPYGTDASSVSLAPDSNGNAGGSQPHSNMQPYLCVNFIISLAGAYPAPN